MAFLHRRLSLFAVFAVLASLLILAPGDARPLDPAEASATSWQPAGGDLPPTKDGRVADVKAERYEAFTLDQAKMRAALKGAPAEGTLAAKVAPIEVSLPAPDGKLQRFAVYDSPVMESGLAARYPNIKTYAGRGVDEPTSTIRFGLTTLGLHATVISERGSWSIDPYYHLDPTVYASYWTRDAGGHEHTRGPGRQPPVKGKDDAASPAPDVASRGGGLVTQRIYRIAIVNDPAYASFFGGGDANVLSAKTALMNRVNAVYNDDLAIKMLLVNLTDALNLETAAEYSGANGPCGATACFTTTTCGSTILDKNKTAIGQLLGASNYDVGHIVLGGNGGGIAELGSVGRANKARGCTGIDPPTGDLFAIDYVAHEVGHQFKAQHTFNGITGSCSGGNRSSSTSVEPGSGSSVMAYAGICGADDLQPHSDPYFSQRSIEQVNNFVSEGTVNLTEVQTASFTGFDGTDSFRIGFGGNTTGVITNLTNYSAATIDAELEALAGVGTVSVTGYAGGTFGTNGFQVTFTSAAVDFGPLSIVNAVGFTGFVGETVQGGPAEHGGSSAVTTTNHDPDVVAPADKTIPFGTPFALTATATDAENDPIVYVWEQNDTGGSSGTALFTQPKSSGPLFRQFGLKANVSQSDTVQFNSPGENTATTDPVRVFPDIAQVAADKTSAATGLCPTPGSSNLDCYSEFLPGSARTMNFRVTARDREPDAGGEANDDVALTIANAGPFRLSSHGTATSVNGNSSATVTWNVASTDIAPVNTANVRISFSTDGGLTFPTELLASTPNDGSAVVNVPNVSTTWGRFKVEAVNNVYFDMSKGNLTVTPVGGGDTTPPETTILTGPANNARINNPTPTFTFSSNEAGTFECAVDSLTFGSCSGTGTHTTSNLSAGTHTFSVRAKDAANNVDPTPESRAFTVDVTPPTVTIDTGPAAGSTTGSNVTFTFSANESSTFQCKMDSSSFGACSGAGTHTPPPLSGGSHTFTVQGTDQAGNAGATSRTWTVNADAPIVTIDSGPKVRTRKRTATFTFHSDDPADALACSIDGGAFTACTSPKTFKAKPRRHTFQVRATDGLGNIGISAAYSWKVLR